MCHPGLYIVECDLIFMPLLIGHCLLLTVSFLSLQVRVCGVLRQVQRMREVSAVFRSVLHGINPIMCCCYRGLGLVSREMVLAAVRDTKLKNGKLEVAIVQQSGGRCRVRD